MAEKHLVEAIMSSMPCHSLHLAGIFVGLSDWSDTSSVLVQETPSLVSHQNSQTTSLERVILGRTVHLSIWEVGSY